MGNIFKTTLLLTALTLLMIFVGNLIGGRGGMQMAFIIACIMNLGAYWFSDKIVLSMYRASPVSSAEAPELYSVVKELADRERLPMPKVYIIPQSAPNAFATGRNPQNSAVAVTEGIVRILNRDELKGVLGHELAHIKNRDILIGTIAATFAGAISMLATMARWTAFFGGSRSDDDEGNGGNLLVSFLMMILAPIAAMLIQMAISRSREYLADDTGAKICGNPVFLANALKKLHLASEQIPMDANPATAHMFIVNPLTAKGIFTLFSTHPPIEERIKRLERIRFDN